MGEACLDRKGGPYGGEVNEAREMRRGREREGGWHRRWKLADQACCEGNETDAMCASCWDMA